MFFPFSNQSPIHIAGTGNHDDGADTGARL